MPRFKSKNVHIPPHHQPKKPFAAKRTISDDASCESEQKKRKLCSLVIHQRRHERKGLRAVREFGVSATSSSGLSLNSTALPSTYETRISYTQDLSYDQGVLSGSPESYGNDGPTTYQEAGVPEEMTADGSAAYRVNEKQTILLEQESKHRSVDFGDNQEGFRSAINVKAQDIVRGITGRTRPASPQPSGKASSALNIDGQPEPNRRTPNNIDPSLVKDHNSQGQEATPSQKTFEPNTHAPLLDQLPMATTMPGEQGRTQISSNLSQAVPEQVAQMTNEQAQASLIAQQRNKRMTRNLTQQSGSGQQAAVQGGQGQTISNSQINQMRNSMSLPIGVHPIGSIPPPQVPGQNLPPQVLPKQQEDKAMTLEQVREMNRAAFPPPIINHIKPSSQMPKHIRTWGQLKHWITNNPQASNVVDISKLKALQKFHFRQIMAFRTKHSQAQQQQHEFDD
ncbi:hypothetical protein N7466_007248 [Penicillium verhagenii]|uniref:uncharacterized protein n=1 Tax=Penicillium verhagenii TaxID=1562060 RepID=UPI002545BC42|nr:uncharacterized protein N7466_007248 [Penicillium verhagenii]KAJ5928292.1 hypothetical protein N7466_007248 [Penicillium verhagenii]